MSDEKPQRPAGMPAKISYALIYDIDKGECTIQGPIQQKLLTIKILADAMTIVANYVPPVIEKQNGGPRIIPANGVPKLH